MGTTSAAVPVIVDAAPTVSISAPVDQGSFRAPATFALSATANDSDGSIAKVEIYQNSSLLQTLTAAPYTINVSAATSGSYSFFAKAIDDLGISTQSAPIAITVNPDVAPLISLTTPIDGGKLKAPASINIAATANDPDGSIVRVDFYLNGTLVGTASQPPYSVALSSVSAGSYTFLARAVDDGGVTSDSTPVTVTVAASQQMYYIHTDQINTPRVVTDLSGKVVWRWDNADPFGEALADEDPDGDGNRFTLNLRFPGQYFDKETGLHYNYFRDYEPGTGRYVESDPIGLAGGLNSYAYVQENPLQWSDRRGLRVYLSGHVAGDMGVTAAGNYTSPPSYHFSIVMRPDNPSDFSDRTGWQEDSYGAYATVGGQPSGVAGGNLVSKPNYPGDDPAKGSYWIDVETPPGMTDTEFINRLIKASRCYGNKQPYSRPNRRGYMRSGTYNSNSYVSGVIKAAGGTPPAIEYDWFQAPGYSNPLPIPAECMCKP